MYDEETSSSHDAVSESSASRECSRRLKHVTIRAFDNGSRANFCVCVTARCYRVIMRIMWVFTPKRARVCLRLVFKALTVLQVSVTAGLAACLFVKLVKPNMVLSFAVLSLFRCWKEPFTFTLREDAQCWSFDVRNSRVRELNTSYLDMNSKSTGHSV